MSTNFPAFRNRDIQDYAERMVFEKIEKIKGAGHRIVAKGTGTQDDEAVYLSIGGLGIHLPKGTNAEVHMVSMGSDTSLKHAFVVIPQDKEHAWKEGQNGLQKWDDPERRLQWGKNRAHITDKNFALTPTGIFEVKDGKVYIRGDVYIDGEIRTTKDIHTQKTIRFNAMGAPVKPEIPGFEAE